VGLAPATALVGFICVALWAEPALAADEGGSITVALHGGTMMEFIWIKPGSFLMGSSASEPDHGAWEGPQHEVTISKGFYLGKFEMTQAQWVAIMGTAPWTKKKYVRANPNHPAVYISWTAIEEFLRRLNSAAGEDLYRLPTEAEWEYACRAGTNTRRFFGDDDGLLGEYAWYVKNTKNAGAPYAQPVGTKQPNPWGLYDIYGNVWEWVQDWYGDSYATGVMVDPTGVTSSSVRVMRGGGFVNLARNVRSAKRFSHDPSLRYCAFGARLVRIK
jgi:formylglycine-generating enzyme required for sulfatase activity